MQCGSCQEPIVEDPAVPLQTHSCGHKEHFKCFLSRNRHRTFNEMNCHECGEATLSQELADEIYGPDSVVHMTLLEEKWNEDDTFKNKVKDYKKAHSLFKKTNAVCSKKISEKVKQIKEQVAPVVQTLRGTIDFAKKEITDSEEWKARSKAFSSLNLKGTKLITSLNTNRWELNRFLHTKGIEFRGGGRYYTMRRYYFLDRKFRLKL